MPLLEARDLSMHFRQGGGLDALLRPARRRAVRAVDGVSFGIEPGETLGLVGESGCGKTTTARLVLRAMEPTAGRILFEGEDITGLSARRLLPFRRKAQIVFQDPYSSLNPRLTVGRTVGEPLLAHGLCSRADLEGRARELLAMVGLPEEHVGRYPHELSGGQRQRVGIARALAVGPRLIVADEAVSALDVSVRAQILNLFVELRERLGLAYLFVSHDLGVVRFVSHRVAVMYLGRLVEVASTAALFGNPRHPYTQALLAAIPTIGDGSSSIFDQPARILEGELPSPLAEPRGCRFASRCPFRLERCESVDPELREVEPGHAVACHLYG
jgi:oligopeptide transport system ATP-binding protein